MFRTEAWVKSRGPANLTCWVGGHGTFQHPPLLVRALP